MHRGLFVAMSALLLLLIPTCLWALDPVAATGPLTAEQKAVFHDVVQDIAPEKLNATRADLEGRHYLTCDEIWLDKWLPRIKDLGGIYSGVGTDQAYTLMGWMKPQLAYLTDYDPWVQATHRAYEVFFAASQTPEEMMKWWDPKSRKKALALLKEKLTGTARQNKGVYVVYKTWGYKIHRRLRRMGRRFSKRGVKSFMNDAEQYIWVRQMVLDGRVKPVLCNLLDKGCFVSLGKAARALNVPMRVIYTSNAEGYWRYKKQFIENMEAQFFDDKSLILRSLAAKKKNGDYRYNSQTGKSFVQWLRAPGIKRVNNIVPWVRIKEDDIPVTHIDGPPPARKK